MPEFKRGLLPLVALGFMVSGCQSFPLFGLGTSRSDIGAADVLAEAELFNERGRQQLDVGQTGAAIESFRTAIAMGEDRAEALNGLGVAYARLDRLDAAELFFAKAMELEPLDERYARNLERVDAARVIAAATKEWDEALDIPQREEIESPRLAQGRMNRVSSRNVVIPAAAVASSGRAMPEVDSRFKPQVRITLPDPPASDGVMLTRNELPKRSRVQVAEIPGFEPVVRLEFTPDGTVRKDNRKEVSFAALATQAR